MFWPSDGLLTDRGPADAQNQFLQQSACAAECETLLFGDGRSGTNSHDASR